MNQYVKYLSGYTISAMLALSSAVTVACFMATSTAFSLAAFATVSCFILNLVLFWQEFDNILNLPKNLNFSNIIPIILTFCASVIMYAFTVFAFYGLMHTYPIIQVLFPIPLVHFISVCCAIGYFGLYIGEFTKLVHTKNKNKNRIPYTEFFLGGLLTAILLACPIYPISLFFAALFTIYMFSSLKKVSCIMAITASAILSINGMGSSLPTLYQFARTPISLYVLKAMSIIGLAALTLCDALFSRNAMNYILDNIPTYHSVSDYFALILIACNALANSQITAAGKGFLNLDAWLGGWMSFIVMSKSTQTIAKQDDKPAKVCPPLSTNSKMPMILALYNGLLFMCFTTWLAAFRPKAFKEISLFLSKPILTTSITTGTIAKTTIFSAHYYLWAKMPKDNNDIKHMDDGGIFLIEAVAA